MFVFIFIRTHRVSERGGETGQQRLCNFPLLKPLAAVIPSAASVTFLGIETNSSLFHVPHLPEPRLKELKKIKLERERERNIGSAATVSSRAMR